MSSLSRPMFPYQNVFAFTRATGPEEKELNIHHSLVRAQLALAPLHKELLQAFVETLTQCNDAADMNAVQAIYEKAMGSIDAAIITEATATLQLYFVQEQKFSSYK